MKILVVDDEPLLREFLFESITRHGHQVVTACDGCEGLKVFQSELPDLIFTDIRMPVMDGFQFLSALRERDQDVVVVIVTGLGSEDSVLEAMRRSANDFLRKPVHQNVLYPLLEKYAGIVETRTRLQETLNLFKQRSFVMQFDNRIENVPHIVQRLMLETGDALPPEHRLGIRIGLVELIANAIEHGNLHISYQEKLAAMVADYSGIQNLHNQRLGDPLLAARRVTVEFTMDRETITWIISDEGEGFDWKSLPNPLSYENLDNPNGRGIFLARLNLDLVEFLGIGNQVRVVMRLRKNAGRQEAPTS